MKNILNITNGDSAVEIMKQAGIVGVFLPWRDVLHEGPVPQNLSLEELSRVRAQFIINQNWGPAETIIQSFIDRDNQLKSFSRFEKVILWFEHDLYDQLQILQILDWFEGNLQGEVELSLICTENYLGMLSPEEMKSLVAYEQAVNENHLALARKAWTAVRSPGPEKWFALLDTDTSALPFLHDAIVRLLEEYPGCANGLSRTAQQALSIINEGEARPWKIFEKYQDTECRRFMGDLTFWGILGEMAKSNPPLIQVTGDKQLSLPLSPELELAITPVGKAVLGATTNWLEIVAVDRWVGGVHLKPGNVWCWDSRTFSLSKNI